MANEIIDMGNVERIINLVVDASVAEGINLLEIEAACRALAATCAASMAQRIERPAGGGPEFEWTDYLDDQMSSNENALNSGLATANSTE